MTPFSSSHLYCYNNTRVLKQSLAMISFGKQTNISENAAEPNLAY